MKQNYINHIAIVLDASSSMAQHSNDVMQVADMQIKHLAAQSQTLDQETRISVYTFSYQRDINCLIYDKDVLRMPSITGLYHANGMTALCSATTLAIKDLQLTPEKYGEHAFLIYIITDGIENDSSYQDRASLPDRIKNLPDHWTIAAFVPDASGVHYAKGLGFAKDNIAVWNTSDSFLEVGEIIRKSTDQYMANRSKGIHGSRSLFNMATADPKAIKKTLTPMTPGSYTVNSVPADMRIDEYTLQVTGQYTPGRTYYEMTKRELIQAYKSIAILVDEKLYMGDTARDLIGLPKDADVRVGPGDHPGYKVFVQSTSMNRKLLAGTDALIVR
jgi:hypothetical protein